MSCDHRFRQQALEQIIPLMEADEKNLKALAACKWVRLWGAVRCEEASDDKCERPLGQAHTLPGADHPARGPGSERESPFVLT